jgi:hypothetical protein
MSRRKNKVDPVMSTLFILSFFILGVIALFLIAYVIGMIK